MRVRDWTKENAHAATGLETVPSRFGGPAERSGELRPDELGRGIRGAGRAGEVS